MDPQTSAPGSGVSQSGGDMGPLPPIHTPESFHAPDTQVPHFEAGPPGPQNQMPSPSSPLQPMPQATTGQPLQASLTGTTPIPVPTPVAAGVQAQVLAQGVPTAPAEEPDTALDEEWVGKAQQVVQHLQADPFLESRELNKLKAQYIKARYNKDIKISEG
jgi:hypothetical protein